MSCYNGGDNNWRLLLSYQVLDTHAVVAWRPLVLSDTWIADCWLLACYPVEST